MRRHRVFSPCLAAIVARQHADDAVRHDDPLWPRRMQQDAMNVALDRVGIDVQLGEAFAKIRRHQQGTNLDADPQAVVVDHDILDVTNPGRRWKAPLRDTGDLAQTGKLAPRFAAILADEDVSRQRSDAGNIAPLQAPRARRPQVDPINAVVDPGPGETAILAAGNADPVGRCEQSPITETGYGADGATGERAMLDRPCRAHALEQYDPVHRSDNHRVGALHAPMLAGSTVRQQDHRALPKQT